MKTEETIKKFRNGQKHSHDFDYDGMMQFALKIKHTDKLEKLVKLAYSFTDVNFHSTSGNLHKAINMRKEGAKPKDIKALIEQFKVDVQNEISNNVVFYYNEKNNDLFAFFPDTTNGTVFGQSYSHIGQHSECHILYVQESRKATEKEYKDLKTELENIGYTLVVQN